MALPLDLTSPEFDFLSSFTHLDLHDDNEDDSQAIIDNTDAEGWDFPLSLVQPDGSCQYRLLSALPPSTPPCISPEFHEGPIEYKLKINPSSHRFTRLVTQLNFRLLQGQGTAAYLLGVSDDGALTGVPWSVMQTSIQNLERMGAELQCSVEVVCQLHEANGKWDVTPEGMCPRRCIAEVKVTRPSPDGTDPASPVVPSTGLGAHGPAHFEEVRVCVCGDAGAGKSTLVGALALGELDDGQGRLRNTILRHPHELHTGHTSSVALQLVGFDHNHRCVRGEGNTRASWARICEESSKVVLLADLAGHPRFLKTTLFALTAHYPNAVALVVSATTPRPPRAPLSRWAVARSHLRIAVGLDLPVCVVVTKVDKCDDGQVLEALQDVAALVSSVERTAVLVESPPSDRIDLSSAQCPVFLVSGVDGTGLGGVLQALGALHPSPVPLHHHAEFAIDSAVALPPPAPGPVVAGTLLAGAVSRGDTLLLGPHANGAFTPTTVLSIHANCLPVERVRGRVHCSFALSHMEGAERGMVLVARQINPRACEEVEIGFTDSLQDQKFSGECIVHCGAVRRAASVQEVTSSGIAVRWLGGPQYVKLGSKAIVRHGPAHRVGVVKAMA